MKVNVNNILNEMGRITAKKQLQIKNRIMLIDDGINSYG